MKIDFLNTECKEPTRIDESFGIFDNQDGKRAYSGSANLTNRIAIVKNERKIPVTFTAIDNCIMIHKEGSKNLESTCDGMLTFSQALYLIELKNQGTGGWQSDAIQQLKNTIRIMQIHIDLTKFKNKKAYVCNKKHPTFKKINHELNKQFFKEYSFRLDINTQIAITTATD